VDAITVRAHLWRPGSPRPSRPRSPRQGRHRHPRWQPAADPATMQPA